MVQRWLRRGHECGVWEWMRGGGIVENPGLNVESVFGGGDLVNRAGSGAEGQAEATHRCNLRLQGRRGHKSLNYE